jgi:hypothetical protein
MAAGESGKKDHQNKTRNKRKKAEKEKEQL